MYLFPRTLRVHASATRLQAGRMPPSINARNRGHHWAGATRIVHAKMWGRKTGRRASCSEPAKLSLAQMKGPRLHPPWSPSGPAISQKLTPPLSARPKGRALHAGVIRWPKPKRVAPRSMLHSRDDACRLSVPSSSRLSLKRAAEWPARATLSNIQVAHPQALSRHVGVSGACGSCPPPMPRDLKYLCNPRLLSASRVVRPQSVLFKPFGLYIPFSHFLVSSPFLTVLNCIFLFLVVRPLLAAPSLSTPHRDFLQLPSPWALADSRRAAA